MPYVVTPISAEYADAAKVVEQLLNRCWNTRQDASCAACASTLSAMKHTCTPHLRVEWVSAEQIARGEAYRRGIQYLLSREDTRDEARSAESRKATPYIARDGQD